MAARQCGLNDRRAGVAVTELGSYACYLTMTF
jgi:hypothetical protein